MHRTSPPPPPPPPLSSTRRRRRFIYNKNLNDNLSWKPNNYNDHRDDYSESDHEPLWPPSGKAMGKQLSKYSFTSIVGKQVTATELTPTLVRLLCPECCEVYLVSEEEDEREPAPLPSKKVLDQALKWLSSPATVYIYYRKASNAASEQLIASKAGNLCCYEPAVDDMTGLIVVVEYNAQTTFSDIPVMVMAHVKPVAINDVMFVNPFAMNAVKTTQIHS